jgi:hypothetical protein
LNGKEYIFEPDEERNYRAVIPYDDINHDINIDKDLLQVIAASICLIPIYRNNFQLEKEIMREFLIEDARNNIEFVYDEYGNRVNEKNGAGRVIYFDLVMIAETSLEHFEDRKEALKEVKNVGPIINLTGKKTYKQKAPAKAMLNLGERAKLNRRIIPHILHN